MNRKRVRETTRTKVMSGIEKRKEKTGEQVKKWRRITITIKVTMTLLILTTITTTLMLQTKTQ